MPSKWILGIGLPVVLVGVILASMTLKSDPQPATAASTPGPDPVSPTGVIRVGSISNEPGREIETFQPFVDYLAAQLGASGIGRGKVIVARDLDGMSKLLQEGKVDLYFDSPFPMLAMQRLQGIEILARRWKKGVSEYHSVLFARKDSQIERLDQLAGKVIAFEEVFSTSSYLLPKSSLLARGPHVTKVAHATADVPAGEVGYVFSNDDNNTVYWVLTGKVAAGAINNQQFDELPRRQRDQLNVFHRTITVPRQLAGVRSDLDPVVVLQIRDVLCRMHTTDEGKRVLFGFERTAKFDAFDDLSGAAVESLKALAKPISAELLGPSIDAQTP